MRLDIRAGLLLLSCLVQLPACEGRQAARQALIPLEPCQLEGLGSPALCGRYEVFENRASRKGRKIELALAVVPALSGDPAPDPVFILAGGPGQSALEVGPVIVRALEKVRRKRDFVLLDQRGTGRSHPLDCRGQDDDRLATLFREDLLPAEELSRCLAELDADPRQYTTPIAMDDLDEVRAALGYERVNLWGASYGTRAALVYIRRHADHARAAVLDGVAPPTMPLPLYFARDGQRALDKLIEACRSEPACHESFPRLASDIRTLLERLEKRPARISVAHPRSGRIEEVTITRDAFAGNLRSFLYSPQLASLVPLAVARAIEGDFAIFVTLSYALSQSIEESMSYGMTLSVVCSEDVPRFSPEDAVMAATDTFLGDLAARAFSEACELWPRAELPPDDAEPVRSSVPVLLLSGELDPVTPPAWAEEAAAHLTSSRHLVVPGVGHGTTLEGCVPEIVARFIETADPSAPEAACLERLERGPFFVSFAGPIP